MIASPRRWLLLLALPAGAAGAGEVYKCTDAHGDVAFQDHPCGAHVDERVLRVVGDEAAGPVEEPPAEAGPAAAESPPPSEPKPRRPLPALYVCINGEDGSRYMSRTAVQPPRLVPLGALGFPGKSLAEAYKAGANVMSAPELSKPPVDNSPRASIAASYTQIQDSCIAASPDQTCGWLRQQYDQTSEKLRRARFKDERAELEPQVDQLQGELGGC
jgi:hypothetical protein